MKYLGKIQDNKDLVTKEYVDNKGYMLEAPYKEVEWVESTGTQFIYLNWKPTAGWGFEADFIAYNAFSTTQGGISANNRNGYGTIFGDRNASGNRAYYLSTYSANGYFYTGSNVYQVAGQLKTDKTRQVVKLHGTTYTKPDGTTMTVTNSGLEPALNMSVFALTNGTALPASYSNNDTFTQYGTARIYSLKFYQGDTLAVDLVGAYRKVDGLTGLYDKVSKHFYPSPGLLKGGDTGDLGDIPTIVDYVDSLSPQCVSTNTASTRLWTAKISTITKLEDGQQFILRPRYSTVSEAQTTELVGKSDSGASYNVYLKLTLADNSETEWIPCYYGNYTRLTTHYAAGNEIRFVYRENFMVNTYGVPYGFWADANYVDGNDVNYYNRENYGSRTTTAALYRYQFCLTKSDGSLVPVNSVNNSVATNKTLTTDSFDPFGEIFYWNSTTTYSANANVGNGSWYRQYLADLRYSFNCGGYDVASTLTARAPLYLVCSPQSDGTAKLHSSPLSMTLPSTNDGLIYIYLGRVYEDSKPYRVVLTFNHPVYWYKNGHIQPYVKYDSDSLYLSCEYETENTTDYWNLSADDAGLIITNNPYILIGTCNTEILDSIILHDNDELYFNESVMQMDSSDIDIGNSTINIGSCSIEVDNVPINFPSSSGTLALTSDIQHVLSGTSAPTSSQGENGDVYIKYSN